MSRFFVSQILPCATLCSFLLCQYSTKSGETRQLLGSEHKVNALVFASAGGLETEKDYPYEAVREKNCSFKQSLSKVQVSGYVNITSDEDGMAAWLAKNGPISIGINSEAMEVRSTT